MLLNIVGCFMHFWVYIILHRICVVAIKVAKCLSVGCLFSSVLCIYGKSRSIQRNVLIKTEQYKTAH